MYCEVPEGKIQCNTDNAIGDSLNYLFISLQFIALGTFDGTIKLLDHTGTFLKDRDYTVVSACNVLEYTLYACSRGLCTITAWIVGRVKGICHGIEGGRLDVEGCLCETCKTAYM